MLPKRFTPRRGGELDAYDLGLKSDPLLDLLIGHGDACLENRPHRRRRRWRIRDVIGDMSGQGFLLLHKLLLIERIEYIKGSDTDCDKDDKGHGSNSICR